MGGPEPNGVVAVFAKREGADAALEWLRVDGLEKRSVSILGPKTKAEDLPPEFDHSRQHQNEIASYWAKWGAMFGAVAGAGPVSIALAAAAVGLGPLAMAVAAGAGAMVATTGIGALASALVGAGIHERQAKLYEQAIKDGKFVVVVHSDDAGQLRIAKQELERLGAESVDAHGITV